jgi:hypothetical protein
VATDFTFADGGLKLPLDDTCGIDNAKADLICLEGRNPPSEP